MEKKYKVFKWTFLFFLVIFLTLYFSQLTGYYEFKNYQKMSLTQDQIAQFEQDIKDGKQVDIKDYVVNTDKDYQNRFSKTGLKLSTGISDFVKNSVVKIFGAVAGFVSEQKEKSIEKNFGYDRIELDTGGFVWKRKV